MNTLDALYAWEVRRTQWAKFESRITHNFEWVASATSEKDRRKRQRAMDNQLLEYDLIEHVYDQLPRDLREKLVVHEIKTDSYHIRATAIFRDGRDRQYQCELETEQVGQWMLACRIPEQFLAHLCAVV